MLLISAKLYFFNFFYMYAIYSVLNLLENKFRILFAIADCRTTSSYARKLEVLSLSSNELEEAKKKERTPNCFKSKAFKLLFRYYSYNQEEMLLIGY